MNRESKVKRPKLIVGVTIGASALSLLQGQLAWFDKQGWEVVLVSTPDEMAIRAAQREGVGLEGIRMDRKISLWKDSFALVQWFHLLWRLRPDAVNLGTPKASLLGGIAAWVLRVPRRLYVVRGLRLEGSSGPLSFVLWSMEWLTMKLATDVLFVSRSLAGEASRRGLLIGGKSWLIGSGSSNGVDTCAVIERLQGVEREEVRERLGLGVDHFVVGFVGRVTRDKGIQTLIEACMEGRFDPRVRVLMVGPLEERALKDQIDSLGNRIVMIPWSDDVWGYLPAMDVLSLPTLREGFPNVVLEAAAAGLPSITTRATGAIDSVVDEVTGILVDVGDVSALVRQVNRLATDHELVRSLGAAARQRALDEFKPQEIWEGLAEILNGAEAVHSHSLREML